MSGSRPRAEQQPIQQEATSKPAVAPRSTAGIQQVLLQKDFQKAVSGFGSAVAVICATHPLDTWKRRLQTSSKQIVDRANPGKTATNYLKACLGTSYGQGPLAILKSSYFGLGKALTYKTTQVPLRLIMQNKIRDQLVTPSLAPVFKRYVGSDGAKILCGGLAGTLTGVLEPIALLKLDSEKIHRQTNPSKSRMSLSWRQAYRPIGWTMLRNGTGSFCVFATEEAVKQFVYKGKQRDQLTYWQLSFGYCLGGIAGVVIPMPADTVKTKMQQEGSARSGMAVAVEMYKGGGMRRFYRSLGVGSVLTGVRAGLGLAGAEFLFPFVARQCKQLAQPYQGEPDAAVAKALPKPKR